MMPSIVLNESIKFSMPNSNSSVRTVNVGSGDGSKLPA